METPPAGQYPDRLGERVLEGSVVRLVPLTKDHLEGLTAAGADPGLYRWFRADLSTPEAMARRVAEQLAAATAGTESTFTVVLRESGEVAGSTSFLEIDGADRTVEIGATWYAREHWGSAVNPEAKLLLMTHAFEDWGANRVWLKTDRENRRSQEAIRRLGAKREGVLRWHMVRRDGTIRDSVVFSVTRPEWQEVKAGLLRRLAERRRS